MRSLVIGIAAFFSGVAATWLLTSGTIPLSFSTKESVKQGEAVKQVAVAKANDLSRAAAAEIIIRRIGSAVVPIPVNLSACLQDRNNRNGMCALYTNCPSALNTFDALQYLGNEDQVLFKADLVEAVTLRKASPSPAAGPGNFVCIYQFTLPPPAASLISTKDDSGNYVRAQAVAYKKEFAGITGIRDSDPSTKIIEYAVKYVPTPFAKTISPNSNYYKQPTLYIEAAIFSKYDDGWRFTQFAR